jgi:hypothetical protein
MRLVMIVLMSLCVLLGGAAILVWSGVYNIASSVPHWGATEWLMEKIREQSISAHSKGIIVPPLRGGNFINVGFRHYHTMCRLCHNAPGHTRTEISQGLYPAPPDFTVNDTRLPSDAEVFWIARNGIKMTGMPAFGSTHSEEELWEIVFFAKRVPNMKPEEYRAMEKSEKLREGGEHHH